MSFSKFVKLRTEDRELNLIQDNIDRSLRPMINNIRLDSEILTGIVLKSGSINKVSHTLNRKLIGWTVIGKNATCDIWDSQSSNPSTSLLLYLNTSQNVTINLEVF
jgi:hypothetical protein